MENAANGFYKVSYNGSTGYALASYLSVDPYNHYVASTTASTVWSGKVVRCNRIYNTFVGLQAQRERRLQRFRLEL